MNTKIKLTIIRHRPFDQAPITFTLVTAKATTVTKAVVKAKRVFEYTYETDRDGNKGIPLDPRPVLERLAEHVQDNRGNR
jgi:hypothetical protein